MTTLQLQFARAEATVNAVYHDDHMWWTAASTCLRECSTDVFVCDCPWGSRLARKNVEPGEVARVRMLLGRLVAAVPVASHSLDAFQVAFPPIDVADGAPLPLRSPPPEYCCSAPGCDVPRVQCTAVKTRGALLRAAQALQLAGDEYNPFVQYPRAPRRARGWLRLSEHFLMDLEEDTSYVPNFAVCPRHTAPLTAFVTLDRYARLTTPKIKKAVTTRMRTASRAPRLSFRQRVPAVPSGVVRFYERFLNPDAKTLSWLESPKADTAVRQVFAMLWKQQNLSRGRVRAV